MQAPKQVGIVVFPDVEVLDFAGPFEVFSVAGEILSTTPFRAWLASTTRNPVPARNGLLVAPNYELREAPLPDLLVLPGGSGSRVASLEHVYTDWIQRAAEHATRVLTVCTGARFAARLGWLDGRDYVTHHMAFEELQELAPKGILQPDARFVATGKFVFAGGVSAGIDAAFHLVEEACGAEAAATVASYMEYRR